MSRIISRFRLAARNVIALGLTVSLLASSASARLGDQLYKLTASDSAANDNFGHSVAVNGNLALVGSRQDDDAGSSSGSAYLFDVATGAQRYKLTASDASGADLFGGAVALSGNTALVGAIGVDEPGRSDPGAAYLFDAATGQEIFRLVVSDWEASQGFGASVALSGGTAAIGARFDSSAAMRAGSVYLFDVATGQQLKEMTASDAATSDTFGNSVALEGNVVLAGAPGDDDGGDSAGSAYLLDAVTGEQRFKLTASDATAGDQFGASVALSGRWAIVASPFDDIVRDGHDRNGAGSVYVFDVTTGQQVRKLTASDASIGDSFGYSVGLSGNLAIIGAYHDNDAAIDGGSAYLFDVSTGRQIAKLLASDAANSDAFGWSVSLDSSTALVGAIGDDVPGKNNVGSAYLFRAGPLPPSGDFNLDGAVDAADYVVWRKGRGTIYDDAGYNAWRTNFGLVAEISLNSINMLAAVPEPAATLLAAWGSAMFVFARRRSDSKRCVTSASEMSGQCSARCVGPA